MKLRTTSVLLALGIASVLGPREARANGDESHSQTYTLTGAGVGVTTVGVGLSGRRETGVDVPLTTADLVVTGIPSGATVVKAYLYWVVYGAAGDATVTFKGSNLTGSLIGTSAHTCWVEFPDTYKNRVYRADVTATVTANGTYKLSGFPSALATEDSQGASLFVVYQDPASDLVGAVFLNDGAMTVNGIPVTGTFQNILAPTAMTAATLRFGVGDGQISLGDGQLSINNNQLTPPAGGHWSSSSGMYWDDRAYDVLPFIDSGDQQAQWRQNSFSDCLVFAYAALDFRSTFTDVDGDNVEDGIDNCPGVANPNQANSDPDAFGDACDVCPNIENPNQQDFDGDKVGDLCDNCIRTPNPLQENQDGDQFGDACDDVGSGGTSSGGTSSGGTSSGGTSSGGTSSGGTSSGGAPSGGAPSGGAPSGGAPSGGTSSGGASSSAQSDATDEGGCGCVVGASADARRPLWALAMIFAATAIAARRRRSGRVTPSS